MKFSKLVQCKFFKILKYVLATILLLSAMIGLLASWYADGALYNTDPGKNQENDTWKVLFDNQALQTTCLVLSFVSIIILICTLTNFKKAYLTLIFTLSMLILIIALLTMASLIITNVEVIKIPGQA